MGGLLSPQVELEASGVSDIIMNVGNESLYEAVVRGQVNRLKKLLKKGANLEAEIKCGIRPLHLAIAYSQDKVLDILIAQKCDVNAVVQGKSCLNGKKVKLSPLYIAIECRNSTAFTALIEAGADVNATNADTTPLQICATLNLTEPARILINKQARVDEIRGNLSALHQAVIKKNKEMVDLLISNGASVNIKDLILGATPLHLAIVNCELNVVELLVRNGADVNVRTKLLDPPVLLSIYRNIPEILDFLLDNGARINNHGKYWQLLQIIVAKANSVQTLKILLKHGLRLNGKMSLNTTPLHSITSETDVEVIQILLDHNIKFNMADKFKLCPIHYAALAGHVDAVQLLIGKGVPVDCVGVNNWTPLFLAAASGYGRVVEVLLLKSADVNRKDSCGQTPLFYALRGLPFFPRLLTPEILNPTGMQTPIAVETMKHYGVQGITNSGDNNTRSNEVKEDVNTIAKILIKNGACIDLKLFNELQKLGDIILNGYKISYSKLKIYTDLFKGATENKDSLVKACINEGAVVDCIDSKLRTPLTYACKSGSCKVVETLLASGANPNLKTESGMTPLHYAALQGDADMVISLLWKGAMYDAQNSSFRKPIHYAKKANNSFIVDFFKVVEKLFHSAKNGDFDILNALKILENVYSQKRADLGINKSKFPNQLNLFFIIKNVSGQNVAKVAQANNNPMFVHYMWDTLKIQVKNDLTKRQSL